MTTETTQPEHTYTGIIVEYSPVDAMLAELRQRYAGVQFDVATKDGMTAAKEVRRNLVKLRTGLEAKRKEIKEPALRRAQAIDAEAKAITAAIKAIEDPIDAQIKVEEERIEAEKRAAEAKRAEIRAKIDGIRNLPLALASAGSEELAAERDALQAFVPQEDVFGDQTEDCKAAIAECLATLTDLHARAMAREAAAALLEAERLKLEQQREEEAKALAAERAELEEARAAIARERAELEALRVAAVPPSPSGPLRFYTDKNGNDVPVQITMKPIQDSDLVFVGNDMSKLDEATETAAVVAELAALPDQAGAETEPAPTDWNTRQAALLTAAQFYALSEKVALCGFVTFATELRGIADDINRGEFDAAIARADQAAIRQADSLLLDATMRCIDALAGENAEAA